MEGYQSVLEEIQKLESMMPSGFFSSSKPDWKAVWSQIRITGSSFKGVKFPTHEEHQQAWDRFQSLVNNVKQAQEEERRKWLENTSESAKLKDRIISQAYSARLSDGIADMVLAIATGGVSVALSAMMGPFDEKQRELEACSSQLKKGWDMLSEYKERMLGRDKQEAFQALNETKEILDRAWEDYKRERKKAFGDYQRERQQRTQENIRKLEERRERLNDILSRGESHLEDLRRKLSDAWSDDYRERVSGWIEEEESRIQDLRSQLSDVENWLYEARSRLNS